MSRNKMRELMAQRHVPVASWDPNLPFQVVEEEPSPGRTFRLPEKNAARRRRLPRSPSGSAAFGSEEYLYEESDYPGDDGSFEDTFDPCKYVNSDFNDPQYDDEEDEYDVNGVFGCDNVQCLICLSSLS